MNAINSINNYLVTQDKKQRVMLYLALVIAILAIAYLFFISDMFDTYQDKQNEVVRQEVKLQKLQKSPQLLKMRVLKKKIQKQNQTLASIQKNVEQKKQQIFAKNGIMLDDSQFSLFLEDIILYAKGLNLTLSNILIDGKKIPYIGLLETKKVLQIDGEGRFLNILKLIRYTENKDILSKLKYLQVNKDENGTLVFDVKFDIAGLL